jgi:hypothetical protein
MLCIYNWYMLYCSVDRLLAELRWPTDSQLKKNTSQLLNIYSIPPDDGLQICLKHVEVDWRNKLRIISASSWFSLHGSIKMHDQQNIKFSTVLHTCSNSNTMKCVTYFKTS